MAAMLTTGVQRMLRTIERAKRRRAKALQLFDAGRTVGQVAQALKISKQRASDILQHARRERAKQQRSGVQRETEEKQP